MDVQFRLSGVDDDDFFLPILIVLFPQVAEFKVFPWPRPVAAQVLFGEGFKRKFISEANDLNGTTFRICKDLMGSIVRHQPLIFERLGGLGA